MHHIFGGSQTGDLRHHRPGPPERNAEEMPRPLRATTACDHRLMMPSAPSTHRDVVRISTEHYVAHLQTAFPGIRPSVQAVVRSLIGALEAALDKGPQQVTADDVPFGVDVLAEADLQRSEADLLRNQFTVGSGAADARVMQWEPRRATIPPPRASTWLSGIALTAKGGISRSSATRPYRRGRLLF